MLDNYIILIITKYINADSSIIKPIVIIKGAILLKRYFTNLSNSYLIIYSSSSYINNKLSFK